MEYTAENIKTTRQIKDIAIMLSVENDSIMDVEYNKMAIINPFDIKIKNPVLPTIKLDTGTGFYVIDLKPFSKAIKLPTVKALRLASQVKKINRVCKIINILYTAHIMMNPLHPEFKYEHLN